MIIEECIVYRAIDNKEKVASCPDDDDDDDIAIDDDDDDCPMRKKLPPSLIARSVTIQLPRCQQDMSAGQKRWLCRMCSTNTQIHKHIQIYKYTNTQIQLSCVQQNMCGGQKRRMCEIDIFGKLQGSTCIASTSGVKE